MIGTLNFYTKEYLSVMFLILRNTVLIEQCNYNTSTNDVIVGAEAEIDEEASRLVM